LLLVIPNTTAGNNQAVYCQGTWNSANDVLGSSSAQVGVNAASGCKAFFTNFTDTVAGGIPIALATGGVATAANSQFTGSSTFMAVQATGTSVFNSAGGNTYNSGTTAPISVASGAKVILSPSDIIAGGATSFYQTSTMSCTFTSGGGTSPSCAIQAGSTNEKGVIIASTGTGSPGTTGTITLTFAGTVSGALATTPACTISLDDSGTAWGNEASSRVSTQSTTAPVFAWTNLASGTLTALTVSSPYRIDYTCTAR
jgi:hypothetical protein